MILAVAALVLILSLPSWGMEMDRKFSVGVDGGLWNNLPMTLFADEENGRPGTLGLALGTEAIKHTPINDLGDFMFTLGSRFSGDEALSNRSPAYADQIIKLDTGTLKTADFSPDRNTLLALQRAAAATTRNYFR